MAFPDDDEELNRAIEMSLAEIQPVATPSSPANIGDLVSSDEEDDDLRQAIALSLGQSERASIPGPVSESAHVSPRSRKPGYASIDPSDSQSTKAQPQPAMITSTSIPVKASVDLSGLDRKIMEQERLERLGKRKRIASPDRSFKLAAKPSSSETMNIQGTREELSSQSAVQYPQGTIKRTWAFKYPRTNDIKIEEVLQTSSLNIAVMSAFQWDDHWLFSKIDTTKVKQMWIMSAKGEDLQEKLLAEATEARIPNLELHFPPMGGQIMNMHSKLMLLFHPTHLRIVVPTANMIKCDWGETEKDPRTGESWQPAVMENSVFLIDLPRRIDGNVGDKKDLGTFGRELFQFLEAQEVPRKVLEGVLKFDFSNTGHIEFVHAIGGSHIGRSMRDTGLSGLASAVCRLGLNQVKELELDYATSSLGALTGAFLKQLYVAACGEPRWSNRAVPDDCLDHVRVYFPSRNTVVNSTGGPACGGIITFRRGWYGAGFPKQCMREYKSTRRGVLSHNKILLARGRKKDNTPFAWAYIGSANLSETAWGAQKLVKSGKLGALTIRSWECGVVVAVPGDKLEGMDLAVGEVPPMSVFEGTLEVPFQYPGDKYEGKEPWFFMEE